MPLEPENEIHKMTSDHFFLLKLRLLKSGTLTVKIVSGSMLPVLQIGQTITIAPAPALTKLKPYDILVYWSDGQLICHYFVETQEAIDENKTVLILRGLKSQSPDFPVEYNKVLGIADIRIPRSARLKKKINGWLRR